MNFNLCRANSELRESLLGNMGGRRSGSLIQCLAPDNDPATSPVASLYGCLKTGGDDR